MSNSVQSDGASPARLAAPVLTRGGDLGILVLRLALGAVFIIHGAQKLFGAFGGGGLEGTGYFFTSIGVNPGSFWAIVVGVAEFVGGIALVLGLFARLAAIVLAIDMIVAIVALKWSLGFSEQAIGWEYNLVLLAALLAVALLGVGALSVAARFHREGRLTRIVANA